MSEYSFDEAKVESIRAQKPWMGDPKYFKNVKIRDRRKLIKTVTEKSRSVPEGSERDFSALSLLGKSEAQTEASQRN
jgi:hypothetical protein